MKKQKKHESKDQRVEEEKVELFFSFIVSLEKWNQ